MKLTCIVPYIRYNENAANSPNDGFVDVSQRGALRVTQTFKKENSGSILRELFNFRDKVSRKSSFAEGHCVYTFLVFSRCFYAVFTLGIDN